MKTNPEESAYPSEQRQWAIPKGYFEKYPELAKELQEIVFQSQGLSKRELFASMAMQGLHAMYSNPNANIMTYSQRACAQQAIIMADALINELNKEAK